MKHRIQIITLLAILALPAIAWGQDTPTAQINRIKANANYIFGEGSMDTQEEAIDLAKTILHSKIEAWKKEQENPTLDTDALLARSKQILTMRGPKHRVLIYIEKPASASVSQPTPQPEPVVEQPVPQPAPSVWTFPLDQLAACRHLADVLALCDSREIESHIAYGNISRSSDPNEVGAAMLVIYAENNCEVRAIFLPKNDIGNRINLRTKQPDSTRNYPGCQAMWIKIKE